MTSRCQFASLLWVALCGCNNDSAIGNGINPDLRSPSFYPPDMEPGPDFAEADDMGPLTECLDYDPSCMVQQFGAPTPYPFDPGVDPNERGTAVTRDHNGYLVLDVSHPSFNYLWVPNSQDLGMGTVSKVNTSTVREVARYPSITCASLKGGSKVPCDGMNGCCSIDDDARYQARIAVQAEPPHQKVQTMNNSPSRTSVDFNGDVWVANRAFGGQSSVTHIANYSAACKDRNINGTIETSADVNGDGVIDTDCNHNGVPDDADDVKQTPCKNALKQEYFGLDDECVISTTNIGPPGQIGRALALGPGAQNVGLSDAWVGTYNDERFHRVDGASGLVKSDVYLPNCAPLGAAVDASGVLWAASGSGAPLCFAAIGKQNVSSGTVRIPDSGNFTPLGSSLDRDQNIWLTDTDADPGVAWRYAPDRSNGVMNLGAGHWVKVEKLGAANALGAAKGIAVDSRMLRAYFAWVALAGGGLVQIPASTIPIAKMDTIVDGSMFPVTLLPGFHTTAAGVDSNQNIWVISDAPSAGIHCVADPKGVIARCDVKTAPAAQKYCPAGDRCELKGPNAADPGSDAYSDFTMFGIQFPPPPAGIYSRIVKGCDQGSVWKAIWWDAIVPPNTSLTVHVRSGDTAMPDASWGSWTQSAMQSPFDLTLVPTVGLSRYLQVEFTLKTGDKTATPRLKSFDVAYECAGVGP